MISAPTDVHDISVGVNPAAFVWALIGAPLLPAVIALVLMVAFAWIEAPVLRWPWMIAGAVVFAVPWGLPAYLVAGSVLLSRCVRRGAADPVRCAMAGCLAHVLSIPVAIVVFALFFPWQVSLMYAVLGLPASLLWGGVFGVLYARLSKSIPRRPS